MKKGILLPALLVPLFALLLLVFGCTAQSGVPGDWDVGREMDPITDHVTVNGWTFGASNIGNRECTGMLFISCTSGFLSVAVSPWQDHDVEFDAVFQKVTLRFGSEKPEVDPWEVVAIEETLAGPALRFLRYKLDDTSDNIRRILAQAGDLGLTPFPADQVYVRQFIERLAKHKKLAVRTVSWTSVFDLSQAAPVIGEVLAACPAPE